MASARAKPTAPMSGMRPGAISTPPSVAPLNAS